MIRYIKLDASTKPEELTALAYKVKAATPDGALSAAKAALLAANPALKGRKTIPKGTVVLVPDVGHVPPASDSERVAIPLEDRGLLSERQIEKLAEQAAAAVAAAKERGAQTAKLLKGAPLRKLIAEQAPELEGGFEEVVANTKRDAEAAAQQERRLDKVFEKMIADMKRLRARMR